MSWGQSKQYFEWKPVKTTRHAAVVPHKNDATTSSSSSSYGSLFYGDLSSPYRGPTVYYPDTSVPYVNGPSYADDSSYSADYPKSQQYQYPPDSGSYENYGYVRDDNFNITIEKYGGFGGTGDTRGFGAYDYPKKTVQNDVEQHLQEDHKLRTEFPDLLRLGKARLYHRRHPVHPLPPPL